LLHSSRKKFIAMGNFGGHALPGSFFIIFAIWWTVQIYRRHFRSQQKGGLPFKASVTYPCDCLCGKIRNLEWEGMLKVFFTLVGGGLEIFTAFKDGQFTHFGNGQHATMFFFFGLSGVIDILVHHKAPLPKDVEYVIATLAFVVEDVLFMFHLHGRTPLDVLVHTLLVYVLHATVIVCVVEMRYRNNVTVSLTRTFLVFLQGTWFWQVGFILYNPIHGHIPWKDDDHEEMMVATMMFAWHMAVVFLLMLSIGVVVRLVSNRIAVCRTSAGDDDRHLLMGGYDQIKLTTRDSNGGHTRLELNESESDEEVGFIQPRSSAA
jgi:hypothetical protein